MTMSASPLLPETPVAKIGNTTILYRQIAADPGLGAVKRIEMEQAQLNARIVDAMLDPILARYGVTVSDEDVAAATPPIMKKPSTLSDSVELHRRIARAVRRVRAGEDRHRVYQGELSREALKAAHVTAMISEQSFAGYIELLDCDAAVDHFLDANSAEKTAQRYRDFALRRAKDRKVNDLVRRFAVEHALALDEARARFWMQMIDELGVHVLVPDYKLPM